jgi:dTDP-4-dehydrorhamnose 3,5-epimerase
MLEVFNTSIDQVRLLNRKLHNDKRGYFEEIFRSMDFDNEVPAFIQDNLSYSIGPVLRGMHLQVGQWQLITVVSGSIRDVTLDLNRESRTFLKTNSVEMRHNLNNQLLIPPGVAHGFAVTSEQALLHYKSTVYYGASMQYGIFWGSPELAKCWPSKDWVVSERDSNFPSLSDFLKTNFLI